MDNVQTSMGSWGNSRLNQQVCRKVSVVILDFICCDVYIFF